jgi:AcrR family transcriptional regulator
MSRNAAPKPRLDRRVKRTRDLLGDALVQLIHEKAFDAITVQDVLARAGVSRSTFYTHFTDKDDLLLSDADEFFAAISSRLARCDEPSRRVAPVREFFAHVAEARPFLAALTASGKSDEIWKLARGHFARGIEQRLAMLPRTRQLGPAQRAAHSHALAGAMLSLLSWWLGRGAPESPEELDELFHDLVWSGVGQTDASVATSRATAP